MEGMNVQTAVLLAVIVVGMILLALFVTVFIIETISRAARKRLV